MSGLDHIRYGGGNAILDALPEAESEALFPLLTMYLEDEATVTHRRERAIEHVHFPLGACYSVLVEMADGEAYEVGVVGREGVVGAELLIGADVAPRTVICQGRGDVVRLPAATFVRALAVSPALTAGVHAALRRQWFVSQQTVACNMSHSAAQRVARWLLMTNDAVAADVFGLRLEFLKLMVAVEHDVLRGALDDFVRREAIRYDAEVVTIVSRAALRRDACECYPAQLLASTRGVAPLV